MQCFHLTFSRGLEKFVYDEFGEHRHSKEDYFYPDAYSLLFVAEVWIKQKAWCAECLPPPLANMTTTCLSSFPAEHAMQNMPDLNAGFGLSAMVFQFNYKRLLRQISCS